jgi:oligopeptide transport system permease protein
MRAILLLSGTAALFLAAAFIDRLRPGAGPLGTLLRRLAWVLVTTVAVHALSFALMRATPGGPFDSDRPLAPEIEAGLRARYRLDEGLVQQWWQSLDGLLRLDFGPSMVLHDIDVGGIVAQSLPASVLLGLAALGWMFLLGLPLGMLAAVRAGRLPDRIVSLLCALWMALPAFVLGSLLLLVFVFWLDLFPAAGLQGIRGLVLPSFCLGAPFAAQIARLLRTGLLEVLDEDWIRAARARGLRRRTVLLRHALRGAAAPVLAFLGPAAAGILTGSLVVESLFGIPGLGTHFVQGALNRDYPLALAMVTIYTLLVSGLTLVCDILHASLDPRVQLS